MATPTLNIGLSEEQRKKVSNILQNLLANTIALSTKTQVCHWNVKGQQFYALHKMFDEQYEQLSNAQDEIAERIRSLGNKTSLGLQAFSSATSIEDLKENLNSQEMLESLLKDHEKTCKELRKGIDEASENKDEGTADFLIARLQEHEKTAWMLRSTL